MKLHVIMVAINNAQMTHDAVKSLVSPVPYHLHLMDQESREPFSMPATAGYTYRRFSPKVALSECWNAGIIEALKDLECEYILIPNNDVLFHSQTVEKLMWGLDNLGYAMVTGENLQPRYGVDQFFRLKNVGDVEFDSRPITDWREEGPDFSCFMIGRDFVEKYGYFDENFFPAYCEDQDMHARIIMGGGHAKRLSIAPYYHFASRTVATNPDLIGLIGAGHERNKVYYREKWGNQHPEVLDRRGFATPFGKSENSIKYWKGSDKYDVS